MRSQTTTLQLYQEVFIVLVHRMGAMPKISFRGVGGGGGGGGEERKGFFSSIHRMGIFKV